MGYSYTADDLKPGDMIETSFAGPDLKVLELLDDMVRVDGSGYDLPVSCVKRAWRKGSVVLRKLRDEVHLESAFQVGEVAEARGWTEPL